MKNKKASAIIALLLIFSVLGLNLDSGFLSYADSNELFTETTVSIANSNYQIPGILTLPAGASKTHPVPAVVLLHGTGGNKNELGDIYKQLAEKLAKQGYASLRIDFVGGGDSKVPFVKNNFADSVSDADKAVKYLQSNVAIDNNRIGLLGWSQGGRIAQVEASRNKSVKALAVWAAASSNSSTDFESMFKFEKQAMKNGSYDYVLPWGVTLKLGKQWFVEMKKSRAMDEVKHYKNPLLVVHGTKDVIVLPSKSKELIKQAGSTDITLRLLENADHGFSILKNESINPDQSTPEKLLQLTADWFKEKL